MAEENLKGALVLLPCNGLSARGQVTTHVSDKIHESMEEVRRVDIVPLLAGLEEETSIIREARAVVGLAGCSFRCEARACRQVGGRELDDVIVVGDMLRPDVIERSEATDKEFDECVLQVSSRLLGILTKL